MSELSHLSCDIVALARRIADAPAKSAVLPPPEGSTKPVLDPSASRLALGLSIEATVTLARGIAALDAIATLAADYFVALDESLRGHAMPEAEKAAEAKLTAAEAALESKLAAHGYLTLVTPEIAHGNAD